MALAPPPLAPRPVRFHVVALAVFSHLAAFDSQAPVRHSNLHLAAWLVNRILNRTFLAPTAKV